MFLIAIAFLAGDCIVQCWETLPTSNVTESPHAALLFFATLLFAALELKQRAKNNRRWRNCIQVCLALLLGIAWAWSNAAWRTSEQMATSEEHFDVDVTGYISSLVAVNEEGVHFTLELRDHVALPPLKLTRVELSWYDTDQRPAPGELWRFHVRLKSPHGYANPGGTDFEAQLFRKGIGASGYVRNAGRDVAANTLLAKPRWRYPILRLRAAITEKLAEALPSTSPLRPMLGIVQGLAVGDTSNIDSAQWRVFANTGTTHLMAISGTHIGMVALIAAWLGGCLARRMSIQTRSISIVDAQAVAALSAAITYAALAGFSIPTQRTLVMLSVYFGTRLLRRQVPPTQSLSLALIGVLLIDPFAPLSPGFWLSFGAISAIFLGGAGRLLRSSRLREYLQVQAAVTVGLLPFLIGTFGSVSLISPLVNILAIPWFTFVIVPVVLLGALVLMLNATLGTLIVHLAAHLLQWSWPTMQWSSALPMALWHFPQWPLWTAVLLVIGCAVLIAPGMLATRMAGAMLCLPALLWQPLQVSPGNFLLTVLDVGQGLSVVVQTHAHVLVFDTGPSFRSGRDTGQRVVLPYLYSRGIRRIDTLMISHGDNDHVGGATSIVQSLPTHRIVVGPSVEPQMIHASIPLEHCVRDQTWQWDGVTFKVLHPEAVVDDTHVAIDAPSKKTRRPNDTSCVLRIVGATASVLLTGDIEHETEAHLLDTRAIQPTDIVVVPHHGSRTSSTAAFALASSPRYAFISAGFGNRWGFPKPEVIDHWHAAHAKILTTSTSGAIQIESDATGLATPREYRIEHRAYWRE